MRNRTVKTLTLLRHGLSTANHDGIAQGQRDYPLHPLGLEQVERLADYWSRNDPSFDLIITSPLIRAKETSRILASALSLQVVEDSRWLERNFGEGEGLAYDQIERHFLDHKVQWSNYEPIFPNSETEFDLIQRASDGLQSILSRVENDVLLVSHGGILNAALRCLLDVPLSREGIRPPGFRFDNTGFTRLRYDAEPRRWVVQFHNARPHLE